MTTILAAVLSCVLPGLAGAALLSPSEDATRFRQSPFIFKFLGIGVASWSISSGLVERTVGVTPGWSWVASVMLGLVGAGLCVLPRARRSLSLAGPALGYGGLILLTTAIAWFPAARLVFGTSWGPYSSTPWYYWNLASDVTVNGHTPQTVTEWGLQIPFLDDYHLFTTTTAMLLTQSPGSGWGAIQLLTLLSVVLMAFGSALLARTFGAGLVGSLAAAALGVATGAESVRLTGYRPEAFAEGLMLLAVAAYVDYLRRSDWGSLATAALLLATLAQVHGIALLTGGVLCVAATLALTPWRRFRLWVRRVGVAAVAVLATVVLVGLLMGAAPGAEHSGGLDDSSGLSDPTWRFIVLIAGRHVSLPPSNAHMVSLAINGAYRGPAWAVAVALGLALAALAVCSWRAPQARRALAFLLLSLLGIMIAASIFAFGWSGYVPRRTGGQRLVQQATVLVAPAIAMAIGLTQLVRARGVRVWWTQLAAAVMLVPLLIVSVVSNAHVVSAVQPQAPGPESKRTLLSVKVPPGAVFLTNGYMEGYIQRFFHGTGLLEGRAPYTFPSVLTEANKLLAGAAAFYSHPRQHVEFLRQNHVDYVLLSRKGSYSLGTNNVFGPPDSRERLDRTPELVRVLSTRDLSMYRVELPGASS